MLTYLLYSGRFILLKSRGFRAQTALLGLGLLASASCGARSQLDAGARGDGGAGGASLSTSSAITASGGAGGVIMSSGVVTGGTMSASSGSMVGCAPGEVVGCYDGPEGSENLGNCKGGAHVCLPDGSGFGPCDGEVLPTFEDCVTPADEDCDGLTPVCGPGWTQVGGTGAAPVDLLPIGMAVDHSGGVILLGVLHGTADLGGGVVLSAPNKVDLALLRYAVDGKLLWTKHFANESTIAWALGGVALHGNDIVIAGTVEGPLDLGKGPIPGTAAFVATLDATGNLIWATRSHTAGSKLAVDSAGNIYTVSSCSDQPLDCQALTRVQKLDSTGKTLWERDLVGGGFVSSYGLAVDSKDNLVITGWANKGLDVGTGPVPGFGIFLAKLDPQGKALWARRYTDTGADLAIATFSPLKFGVPWSSGVVEGNGTATAFALAVAPNDDVILTGRMVESLDFGGGPITSKTNGLFYARIDPNGEHVWSRAMGSGLRDTPPTIAVTPSGEVVTAAYSGLPKPANPMVGGIDFGGGILPKGLVLARLDAGGKYVASASFPSGGQWSWLFVGATPDAIYLAGAAHPDITIGGKTGSGFFLAKLVPGP